MTYCSSKMTIVKIVLFITILSSFGEHKGVQGSNDQINKFLTFYKRNMDLFCKRCFYVLYVYISKELYYRYDINTENITPLDIQRLKSKNQKSSADYYLRLLRLHDSFIDFSIIKPIDINNWTLYIDYKRWIELIPESEKEVYRKNILEIAEYFIGLGIQENEWNYVDLAVEDNIQQAIKDYKTCDQTLSLISISTNYVEKQINYEILKPGPLEGIMNLCENVTKFGYIMHLLVEDEYKRFLSLRNTNEKDTFIINVMKTELNNIYLTILRLLNEIEHQPMNSVMFNEFLNEDNEVANQIYMLIILYSNVIDTTKIIFGVFVNGSGEPYSIDELKQQRDTNTFSDKMHFILKEYYFFIQHFQTKFNFFCPDCFGETIETYTSVMQRNMNIVGYLQGQRSRYTKLPLIFGIYNTCWYTDWMTRNNPDGFDDIEIKNINLKNITLKESILLEMNAYLTVFHQYAIKIKNYPKDEIMNTFYDSHKGFIYNKNNRNQNKSENPIELKFTVKNDRRNIIYK